MKFGGTISLASNNQPGEPIGILWVTNFTVQTLENTFPKILVLLQFFNFAGCNANKCLSSEEWMVPQKFILK